jgi:hypothetical protein
MPNRNDILIKIKSAERRGEWIVILYEEDKGIIGYKTYDKMPWIFLLNYGNLVDKISDCYIL